MKKILCIDDDPNFCNLVKKELEQNKFECFCSNNGKEGFDEYNRINPDAIVLDLEMPKCNGYDFLKMIRAKDTYIPIIICSQIHKLENQLKAFDYGSNTYFLKSNSNEPGPETYDAIKIILHYLNGYFKLKSNSISSQIINFGNGVIFNNEKQCIQTSEGDIKMNKLEWDILWTLVISKDHFATKESLINIGWDTQHFTVGFDRIRKAIYNIKKTLNPLKYFNISTAYSKGYKLEIKVPEE